MDRNVSVIIPSYNRAHVLHRTIPTYIQNITLEVIIVDDGSDDNTRAIVRKLHEEFKLVKYIRLNAHKGLPYAKNAGVYKARGKYIFFGDDDAVLYEGTLFRLREAIEKLPADIAGTNGSYATHMQQIRYMDRYISEQFVKKFNTKCIVDLNTGNFCYDYKIDEITEGLYAMSPFLIKAEFAKTMKFDVSYIANAAREDMDYLVRQPKQVRKMIYVPDTYEIDLPRSYVKGGGSHTLKQWENDFFMIRNNNYFINRHYDFLKEKGYISVSKRKAKWNFGRSILKSMWLRLMYRMKQGSVH